MKRRLFNLLSALSLALCLATCVLWLRGRTGYDEAEWTYDRYLSDRSAASSRACFTSDNRLWLDLSWGRVGPFNGQLVWGYYIAADQSGGHPRFTFRHERNVAKPTSVFFESDSGSIPKENYDLTATGWGPVRWYSQSRSMPRDGDDFRYIRFGVSHWLLAIVFLVLPILSLNRFRKARRTRGLGRCRRCGYDLRATPERCPECGMETKTYRIRETSPKT